ncbi:MAG: GGDEF domain-containing protein [Patescibacteria group bacterium]
MNIEKFIRKHDFRKTEINRSLAGELTLLPLKTATQLGIETINDSLTGLYDYRFFNEILPKEMTLAKRFKSPLSILMMDLDKFTQVNSEYGTTIGDQALFKCAKILRQLLRRQTEIVCRVAGDAFAAILPQTDLNQAKLLAEHINQVTSQAQIIHDKKLTYSIGVATMTTFQQSGQFQEIVNTRLLKAKEKGRNLVVTS